MNIARVAFPAEFLAGARGAGLHRRLRLPARRAGRRLLGVRAGAACRRQHRRRRPRLRAGRPQGCREPRARRAARHRRHRRRHALAGGARACSRRADEPQNNVWYLRDPDGDRRGEEMGRPPRRSISSRRRRCRPAACRSPASSRSHLPDNHLQYAITWFGLALGLAGVYVVWLAGRIRGASVRRFSIRTT